ELQQNLLKLIDGFKDVKIIRPGYAIEYDFVDPRELRPTMETSRIKGLFLAGQINGTTGYEEAACQGLMAGINAALLTQKRESVQLTRNSSYIGVLIDDLIRHGVDEPYRIFTSRAEARLTLRHDNADQRLMPFAKKLGLLFEADAQKFDAKLHRISRLKSVLDNTRYKRSDTEYASISQLLNVEDLGDSITLSQLSKRQNVSSELIFKLLPEIVKKESTISDLETALADILYKGYEQSQNNANERVNNNDNLRVMDNIDFKLIKGLSSEMLERLERANPRTFADIRNISGLTPSAVSALLVFLSSLVQNKKLNVGRATSEMP
nr:FAD-dependent oxidoreductase [Acidobacteriota bacterium]